MDGYNSSPVSSSTEERSSVWTYITRNYVTALSIALCGGIYVFLNFFENEPGYGNVEDFLFPSSIAIWSGSYWGLLTSAFVHIQIWHIGFNMWWLKDFGSVLEPTLGHKRYALFIAIAGIVSSAAELLVTGHTGIGFSGIIYAMFGYMLASRDSEPLYKNIITQQLTIWLLGWLVLCVILTYANAWNVANFAHIGGFIFGYATGDLFKARRKIMCINQPLPGQSASLQA